MTNLFSQYARFTANPDQALSVFDDFPEDLRQDLRAWSPRQLQALLSVLGNSNFLARWAKRRPEQIVQLHRLGFSDFISSPELTTRLEEIQKLPTEAFAQAMIELKYQCLFAIALEDLGGLRPFESIVGGISRLATTILRQTLLKQESELAQKLGIPLCHEGPSRKVPFAVIGMGKLGGGELNFSSDVDLIYFYGSDRGEVRRENQSSSLTPHEYFTKLSEALSRCLSQKTLHGFLYRVDLELRPEGKFGPLANSIDAMVDYYETFGADWEKQAMIKASCAAGEPSLFDDFFAQIHPFVYPRSTDFSFLKNLGVIKEKIMRSVAGLSDPGYHVKLGDGGIREIEFFAQAFQFLLGGKIPSLQTTSTLKALDRLRDEKLIEASERDSLREAYIFLRTLEHRLQLVEERQTHQMPAAPEEIRRVARRMGYRAEDPDLAAQLMLEDLDRHRQYVKQRFEDLLSRGA